MPNPIKELPATFIQYGRYHSRTKRDMTKFSVVYGVDLAEVEKEVEECILRLNHKAIEKRLQK